MKFFNYFGFLLFLLCSSHIVIAQKGVTYVTYKVVEQNEANHIPKKAGPNILDENRLEFELLFDTNCSIFKMIDKLVSDDDKNYRMTAVLYGGKKTFFKDNLKKQKIYNTEYQKKRYNVELPFNEYEWKIQNEIKIIQGFKCYKAIASKEVEDKGRNTKEIQNAVVWFTSEIPSSFGPKGLDGLPGLVLEGTAEGRRVFYATKIIQGYGKSKTIERPIADETISEEEYAVFMAEKYKQYKEKLEVLKKEIGK